MRGRDTTASGRRSRSPCSRACCRACSTSAGGGALLDLGCGDGLAARLGGRPPHALPRTRPRAVRRAPCRASPTICAAVSAPSAGSSFDVYLGSSASRRTSSRGSWSRLLREIGRHARPGAIVALEALGRYSLEWPRLWRSPVGAARLLPYRLGADVTVHPWAPRRAVRALRFRGHRTARRARPHAAGGPKVGSGRYWPGLPPLRARAQRPARAASRSSDAFGGAAAPAAGRDAGARAPGARRAPPSRS